MTGRVVYKRYNNTPKYINAKTAKIIDLNLLKALKKDIIRWLRKVKKLII
jgi:hypothetical protein